MSDSNVTELREGLLEVKISDPDSVNLKDLEQDDDCLGIYADNSSNEKFALIDVSQYVNSKIQYIH